MFSLKLALRCSQSSYPNAIDDDNEEEKEKNDKIIESENEEKEEEMERVKEAGKEMEKVNEKKTTKGKGRGNGNFKGKEKEKEKDLKTKISEINKKISKEENDIDKVIKIVMNKTEAFGRLKAAAQLKLLLSYLLKNKNI